ncbi:MAG: branched-chain amino acid ABC transporter permease [Clostridiales bacterium]|nr:branched-chain amino acid ABC transporter permease [Clostridiales bacterium]
MRKLSNNTKYDFKFKYLINYCIVLVLLGLGLALMFTGGLKMSFARLLTQIGFSIILAVSLNLVVGFLGELSLGHAGFMCIGAYIGGFFGNLLSNYIGSKFLVLVLTMIIGGALASVFGFIIGLPSLRLKGDYLAIVTLAFGEIVRNIFKNQKAFGGAMGLSTGKIQFDSRNNMTLFIITFAIALIMLFVLQNLVRSKHGRAITAIRDNEIAAKAMGINVTFYKLLAFIVASFFAGVAGVIYAHYTTPVSYTFFSYNYSIEILVMVVLGGMGNITGSIIAATLISCVNFFLQSRLSGDLAALRYLIYALVLIFIIIFSNAPALRPFKEKYGIAALSEKIKNIFRKKSKPFNPAVIKEDEGSWDRIPTKIDMDALLSTDINPDTPDEQEGADKKSD